MTENITLHSPMYYDRTNNEIKTGVTSVLDNSINYENYTTRDNYNINHYAGRVGAISVVENNTGSASIDYGNVSE